MEVLLSPEQEAQLAALAAQQGRALADEARFAEAVKQGLASLDRGEYVSHEEVGGQIGRLFRP